MKQKLLLLLIALMLLTTGNAWGAGEIDFKKGNRIGAEDNSTTWYGQVSEIIELAPNKTLTLEFKTYTATDEQLGETAWNDQLTHAINIWDSHQQNLYMKGNSWGWKGHSGSTNDPEDYDVNSTGIFNNKTYGWGADYRTMIGDGADVVMTIERYGKEIRISQEFTTSSGSKYYHYFVGPFGASNESVWCQMTIDRAHIDISEDYTITNSTQVSGTLQGVENNTGAFGAGAHEDFSIAKDGSLTLHFINYTNRLSAVNNWTLEFQQGDKYFDLGSDNRLWGDAGWTGASTVTWNTPGSGTYNWTTYNSDINGADVVINITRSGKTVTITALQTSTTSKEFGKTCTFDMLDAEGNNAVTARLKTEGGHLDLLPVSASISSYGWATFSSDYALDFSKATTGLEAYMITDHEGNVVTTSKVTGTVPAGTGLLLKGAEGDYNIPIVGSSETNVSTNKLVAGTGAKVSAESGKTKYVLGVSGSDKAEFQKITETAATVATGKAYLQFNEVISGARALIFDPDEATSINTVDATEPEAGALKDGKFLENGKIVIVKNGVKYSANGQILK